MRVIREVLKKRCRGTARRRFWDAVDRDSYECPVCGYRAQGIDREFEVHHRDGDWLNNHPLNLVAVCWTCHRQEHRERNTQGRLQRWKGRLDDLGGASS